MDSSSAVGGNRPFSVPAKTEWANDVRAPVNREATTPEESFGAKLNRISGVVDTGKTKYGAKSDALSKEAFLKMTMEQIKYQDPLNPVKNDQFTQQMAMLSQLEQQVNMNSTLSSILDQSKNMQIAALQLVGKDVRSDSGFLYHENAKASGFQFNLPQSASEVKVNILNEAGETLDTINVGPRESGTVSAKWNGVMANGVPAPSGKYNYSIEAKGTDGKAIKVDTKVDGRVTGVTTVKGATYLLIGEQKVALNDVQSIYEAKNSGPGAMADGKSAGTENVSNKVNVGKELPAVGVSDEATVESKPKGKPLVEVSDGAQSALKGDSEVGSLFPILYR